MSLYNKLKDLNPTFQENPAVTGPGGQQYAYSRPQLDEASARRMAEMMGGALETVGYNGGPFQTSPQYQIRVPGTSTGMDASMIWDDYLRSAGGGQYDFDKRRQAEIDLLRMSVNDASPGPGFGGGGGSGGGPTRGVVRPGGVGPGPTWPTPAIPPRPDYPDVLDGDSGVRDPGGWSPGWRFPGSFPPPLQLLPPTGLPRAHRRPSGLLLLAPSFAGGLLQP